MASSEEVVVSRARADLAERLGVSVDEIEEEVLEQADFPDMALGAAIKGEMSGQMITRGWRIRLKARGQAYEYRAANDQLRLYNYQGKNFRVNSK